MSPAPRPAAVARHPHLAAARPGGGWRVDCHVHTMWSGDSTTTPAELATAILETGLDAVCITDHSTVAGALRLRGELPCQVVVGQEQRTPDGELIGLFLEEAIPAGCRSAREAAEAIRAQGGLVYVPHPFDPMRHHLRAEALGELAAEGLLDVIEVENAKTSLPSLNARAAEEAERLALPRGAGSDAHVADSLGAAYVEMAPFAGSGQFLAALRAGRAVGHHYDEPRRWRARVVPSTRRLGREDL